MKPAIFNIDFTQQNDYSVTVNFQDEDGNPLDYTDLDFEGNLKEQADVASPEWAFVVDDSAKATGVIVFSLSNTATEDMPDVCEYELRMYASEIFTFMAGKARIRRSVFT